MNQATSLESSATGAITNPPYISHYGIRAKRYRDMIQWYKTVFRAKIQHENDSSPS